MQMRPAVRSFRGVKGERGEKTGVGEEALSIVLSYVACFSTLSAYFPDCAIIGAQGVAIGTTSVGHLIYFSEKLSMKKFNTEKYLIGIQICHCSPTRFLWNF